MRVGLTFDMRGGRQAAKPAVGRPLDGRVRALRVMTMSMPLFCVDDEHNATGPLEETHSIADLAMHLCSERSRVPEAHRPSTD
jgi:hypothetical protein